jgi:hypothetical protein
MSKYTHFTKLKHLIFLNGGSTCMHWATLRGAYRCWCVAPNALVSIFSFFFIGFLSFSCKFTMQSQLIDYLRCMSRFYRTTKKMTTMRLSSLLIYQTTHSASRLQSLSPLLYHCALQSPHCITTTL